jgi:hypothetical protein
MLELISIVAALALFVRAIDIEAAVESTSTPRGRAG